MKRAVFVFSVLAAPHLDAATISFGTGYPQINNSTCQISGLGTVDCGAGNTILSTRMRFYNEKIQHDHNYHEVICDNTGGATGNWGGDMGMGACSKIPQFNGTYTVRAWAFCNNATTAFSDPVELTVNCSSPEAVVEYDEGSPFRTFDGYCKIQGRGTFSCRGEGASEATLTGYAPGNPNYGYQTGSCGVDYALYGVWGELATPSTGYCDLVLPYPTLENNTVKFWPTIICNGDPIRGEEEEWLIPANCATKK